MPSTYVFSAVELEELGEREGEAVFGVEIPLEDHAVFLHLVQVDLRMTDAFLGADELLVELGFEFFDHDFIPER